MKPSASLWPADKVERRPIAGLKLYAKNARLHSPAQVEQIAKSMGEFGWTIPILLDERGEIIAGHGRALAAKKLGYAEAPCMVARGWSKAQIKAYRLADNQLTLNAAWDPELLKLEFEELEELEYDLDLTGFSDEEIARYRGGKVGLTDPDEAPEAPANPVTRLGDVWLLGATAKPASGHRLVCGDSTTAESVDKALNGSLADCVFTSPPYGVGCDYDGYDDTLASLRKMLPMLAESWRTVLPRGGFAVVNFGDIISAAEATQSKEPCEYPMALEYWPAFRAQGWSLWSRRVWCKPGARTNAKHCISSNRAAPTWEHIWTWKKPGKPVIDRQIAGEYASQMGWRDTSGASSPEIGKDKHPAGMPVAPAIWNIEIHSRAGHSVFEPFSGTGTTIIAGEMTGRCVHAIEISPAYVDVSVDRWQNFTGREATLEATGKTFAEVAAERQTNSVVLAPA